MQIVTGILQDLYAFYQSLDQIDEWELKLEVADKIHKFLSLDLKAEGQGGIPEAQWQAFLREVEQLPPEVQQALKEALDHIQ